jgi:hypothetical protein
MDQCSIHRNNLWLLNPKYALYRVVYTSLKF